RRAARLGRNRETVRQDGHLALQPRRPDVETAGSALMAITFPRELNSYQLAECTFSIVEGVAPSRAGKGRAITAIDQFDPWVMARIRTGPLTHAERRAWSAWKNSLRGGMKHFLAYDQARSWLLNYPHGVPEILAETWDGEAIVTELSAY